MQTNIHISTAEQWTAEWLAERAWKITGTRLGDALPTYGKNGKETETSRKKRQNLIYELIAEKLAPLPEVYTSFWMDRGKEMEEIVKKIYGENIENVGFVSRTDVDWFWISPDGIIRDENGRITRAVEIKSPAPKTAVRYILDDKIPDEYFWQIVHYFIVFDELETLDFVVYNPDFYAEELRIQTRKITRESIADKIEYAKNELVEFRQMWLETAQKFMKKFN